MGIYLRQSYNIKPNRSQLGSDADIQVSIFKNAERVGIDPACFELMLPLWSHGAQFDYAKNNIFNSFEGNPYFAGNSWNFQGDTAGDSSITASNLRTNQIGLSQYTFIINASLYSFSSGGGFFSFGSFDPTFANDVSEKFYIYDGGSLGLSNNTLPFNEDFGLCFVRNSTLSNGTDYYYNGVFDRSVTHNANISASTYTIGSDRPSAGLSLEGSVSQIILLSTALSRDKIAYFADNPYFLLQRVAPVFYSIPASGPVTFKPFWASQTTRIAI